MRFIIAAFLLCITTLVHAIDLKLPFSSNQNTFLNVNQAFQLSVSAPENGKIKATWIVADGYYLYQHQFKLKGKDSDKLTFSPFPIGEDKYDVYFGDVVVYRDRLIAEINYDKNLPEGTLIHATLGYQGCADKGLCYPPQLEPFEFVVPLSTKSEHSLSALDASQIKAQKQNSFPQDTTIKFAPSETSIVINVLENHSWITAAVTLFGLGLLLSLTPCVLPMIPIVSAIVVGHKKTPLIAFYYSTLYVISMALTYALIGGLVGFFGLQLNIQAYLQNPVILLSSAALFILLAFAMFGVYELRLPTFIQAKLQPSNPDTQSNKSLGVALSAVFATLVVSPCVSAPLAGVLLFISTQGETAYGALMLFIMALGMGVPLLLVGMFGPSILPRSGEWLDDIKVLMGFGLIAVSIWLVTRWISLDYHLYLWGLLSLSIASYFLNAIAQGKKHPLRFLLTTLSLLIGILYFLGGANNKSDLVHPLKGITSATKANVSTIQKELPFATITSLDELTLFIQSNKSNNIIMLDFYADWCISCKVIEHEIFYNEAVHPMLRQLNLVRVDVTKNDAGNQNIMQRFNVFGPPALIFLTSEGKELTQFSLIGEPSLKEVIERLSFITKEFSQ
ncbi:protein-disulfide reductase DsbD [Marinomonas sp. 15G1-11]|uniref:Protein-disulfide reductase DsbD n=1 Tax=Marinomonas phaeophyticola TaxID=3004091 RepID=A0ABT4JXD4_9GAMM|nr:protein-disulfide reductase DsbD [Marinomonas sp. 15G1-11]MCZ2722881.1 protein-disulfide reductase DsbD [Marinomonas sp. 15G1-11]